MNLDTFHKGVPPGTILVPLLFNIYVNDLAKIVENDCAVVECAEKTFLLHPTLM